MTHRRADDLEEDERGNQPRMSDKSYIQIGLVLTLVGFIVGCIWWAATMQSKMDQVIEEVKTSRILATKVSDNETKVKILELRIIQVESMCVKK